MNNNSLAKTLSKIVKNNEKIKKPTIIMGTKVGTVLLTNTIKIHNVNE